MFNNFIAFVNDLGKIYIEKNKLSQRLLIFFMLFLKLIYKISRVQPELMDREVIFHCVCARIRKLIVLPRMPEVFECTIPIINKIATKMFLS